MKDSQKHIIGIDSFPDRWLDGLPLGNGEVGVMLWGDSQSLKLSLDHANAWDSRSVEEELNDPLFNYQSLRKMVEEGEAEELSQTFKMNWRKNNPLGPTKINLGRLEIVHNTFQDANFELSIDDAVASANLENKQLESNFELFVSKHTNSVVVRMDNFPVDCKLNYIPFYECCEDYKILNNPEVEILRTSTKTIIVQHILPDKYFAICYRQKGKELYVSFAYAQSTEAAKFQAEKNNNTAINTGYLELKDKHLDVWRQFWSKSSISIPGKEYENLWYFGLYLLNSSAVKGMYPPGLQGVWATDGFPACWRGDYHADMNVQETFAMACGANHVELLDVWLDYICGKLDKAKEFTRRFFGSKGAFQVCSTVPEHVSVTGSWTAAQLAWSHTGWLALLAWQRWRYTMDKEWLVEKGYPFVAACFEFYAENLELEADAKYHIPLSSSPEYDNDELSAWCKDPNIDIALIRKCCDWVLEMETALDISILSDKAKEIKTGLVEYHLVEFHNSNYQVDCENVLGLWKNKILDESHRHPSHLMPIYPAMDITIEGNEKERQIIEESLLHYLSLGQFFWAGHGYIQMISLAAVVGKNELAFSFLKNYCDNWVLPNLLHHNSGRTETFFATGERADLMTIEASCGVVEGINNMLLQSWNGIIRLFPAIPAHWKNIGFSNLLAEGGFEVSASRQNGQVTQVAIKGIPGKICKVKNSFNTQSVLVDDIPQKMLDSVIEFKMPPDGQVSLNIG